MNETLRKWFDGKKLDNLDKAAYYNQRYGYYLDKYHGSSTKKDSKRFRLKSMNSEIELENNLHEITINDIKTLKYL